MKKSQTNVEFVTTMMEYSKAGGLKQAFIIEAIDHYSKEILKSLPWDQEVMIAFEAWKQCAQECQDDILLRNLET